MHLRRSRLEQNLSRVKIVVPPGHPLPTVMFQRKREATHKLNTQTLTQTQGRRKHLKLGGARHFEGTSSLRKRGHFLKTERALLCLLQNLGGYVPLMPPVPTSMHRRTHHSKNHINGQISSRSFRACQYPICLTLPLLHKGRHRYCIVVENSAWNLKQRNSSKRSF